MYAGTGARFPRSSTWQYLHTPIPVLLLIHLVSYSRQRPQYTVCPFHFRHWLMYYRSCQSLIKMLELTALLTKDKIEPFRLTGMRAPGLTPWSIRYAHRPDPCPLAPRTRLLTQTVRCAAGPRRLKRWLCYGQLIVSD